MTVSGLTMRRAERQSCQHFAKVTQNSRSRKRREGRLAVRLRMASCWRRARISAISSRRGAKKERAREKRRGQRAISEKQNREIQIQKWVSSIRGRSCKCKRLKVGWDFRYAQGRSLSPALTCTTRTLAFSASRNRFPVKRCHP